MRIEDEIKQKSFEDEYHKLHVNIAFTAAWAGLRMNTVLRPFRISNQQFNLLRILRGQYPQPASIRELTDRMLDKSSNASRLVDKLIQKNLVRKQACSNDSRRTDVVITEAGLELIGQASEAIKAEVSNAVQTLSEAEARQVNLLLDKMRGGF